MMVRIEGCLGDLEMARKRQRKAEETYNKETDGQNCPICGTVLGEK